MCGEEGESRQGGGLLPLGHLGLHLLVGGAWGGRAAAPAGATGALISSLVLPTSLVLVQMYTVQCTVYCTVYSVVQWPLPFALSEIEDSS